MLLEVLVRAEMEDVFVFIERRMMWWWCKKKSNVNVNSHSLEK